MIPIVQLSAQLDDVSSSVDRLLAERDSLSAALATAIGERDALLFRQQGLFTTIRNLSSSVPYAEEAGNAATLIAEGGTLRAEIRDRRTRWNEEAERHEALRKDHCDERDELRDQLATMTARAEAAEREVQEALATIAARLPHPNRPGATSPGDVDAWDALAASMGIL